MDGYHNIDLQSTVTIASAYNGRYHNLQWVVTITFPYHGRLP
jgi:hypothetical protein